MSIERELLKKVISGDNKGDFFISYDLYKEIYEFLVHPEQSEQEPVAWMYDHQIEVGYDKYTEVNIIETCARNLESNNCINIRPLYLAPPKQEPLSVERIADLWTDIITNSVRNFARAIEKEHGIGGGNE